MFCRHHFAVHATLVLLVMLAFSSASAQPGTAHSISPRVGSTLDAGEVRYFGFFSQRDDIDSIVVTTVGERLRYQAFRSSQVVETVFHEPAAAAELGRYIDNFENLFTQGDTIIDWQKIKPRIVRPDRPLTRSNTTVTVADLAGRSYTGRLMWASPDGVIIYFGEESSDVRMMIANSYAMVPSQIKFIDNSWDRSMRVSAGVLAEVDGSDARYRREAYRWLSENSWFTHPAPEFATMLQQPRPVPEHLGVPTVDRDMVAAARSRLRRFHASVFAGVTMPSDVQYMQVEHPETVHGRAVNIGKVSMPGTVFGAELLYATSYALRFGAELAIMPASAPPPSDSTIEYYNIGMVRAGGNLTLVVLQRHELGNGFLPSLEASVQIAPAITVVSSEGRIATSENVFDGNRPSSVAAALGGGIGVAIGYYFGSTVSLHLDARSWHFLPVKTSVADQMIPGSAIHPDPLLFRRLEIDKLGLRSIDLGANLKFHF